jgi:cytochrome c oxidase assembly protein subunit 15
MTSEAITGAAAEAGTQTSGNARRRIAVWLFLMCTLLALMVLVGGATRLTHSGLSITEWRPVTGIVPPLSDEGWGRAFEKYQKIPQFRLRNPEMSLDAFKGIYWWEWVHRLLGRLIGFAFLGPLVWFAARRQLGRALTVRLAIIFLLGGAQGALGWYMVKSGLATRIDVSQYRLAAHLGLAFLIFGFTFGTALDFVPRSEPEPAPFWVRAAAGGIFALVFVQILLGALVAGLKAGFVYNTWPLMAGRLWPEDYWRLSPWFANWGENPAAVQADHRLGAYLLALAVAAVWVFARKKVSKSVRRALNLLGGLVAVQMALGISTLVSVVPLTLALLHQGVALALFAASVNLLQATLPAAKEPGALAFR